MESDLFELLPVSAGCFRLENGGYLPIRVNRALCALLGLSGEELARALSVDPLPFVHKEEAGRVRMLLYKAGVAGGSFRETVRVRDSRGQYRWMELRLNAEVQTGGALLLCLALTDANVSMERQKKLDATYTQLLDVMNNTPGGIVAFDTLNNRTPVPFFASQGMERLLGGSRSELETAYRQDPYRFVHPEDWELTVRTIEDALRNLTGFQLSIRLHRLDGDYVWVSASGMIDKVEDQRLIYMAFVDSSDDRENRHILKQILDSFVRRQYEHICCIDGRNNRYFALSANECNDPFLPEQGDDYDGDMRSFIAETVAEEDSARFSEQMRLQNLLAELEKRDDLEYFFCVTAAGGKPRYKKVWLSWIDREARTIALVCGDVTEEHRRSEDSRETLRAALRAAELANAAKSEFLSRMSHDIRTPLNAIIGYTEMSLEDPTLTPETRDYLLKADSSSKFLLTLINDILNMSRIESGKLAVNESVFAMKPFVESISAIVCSQCEAKNIRYICKIGEEVSPYYVGDQLKLQQVLLNIISNSVKFTPPQGSISLRAEERGSGGSRIVRFTVEDSGCGISREFLPHLFDPFSQEHRGADSEARGTGLGLAICRSLVDMMGGTILVESEKDRGSVFAVEVPLKLPETETPAAETVSADAGADCTPNEFPGKRILLAEDNELNTEIARHILEKAGLTVETAENGKLACESFAASPEGYFSAVLMDIRMPLMDGLEASRCIRHMERGDRGLPIIAMSANAFEEDIRQAMASGMNAYTIKPIDPQQLFATLRKFIR